MHRHRLAVCLCTFALAVTTPRTLALLHVQQSQPATSGTTITRQKEGAAKGQESGDQIQLKAKLVSLTVTVLDPYGRFVTGLTKRNFEVFDDGVKQEITHFTDEDAPVTLGIVYDVSGSMGDLTSRSFQALRRLF